MRAAWNTESILETSGISPLWLPLHFSFLALDSCRLLRMAGLLSSLCCCFSASDPHDQVRSRSFAPSQLCDVPAHLRFLLQDDERTALLNPDIIPE